MNRDDKAHRFVVTWNAFLDGNRLAYLALVLAIGVDALVFMSGLFGAQALRSPLSDVPSPKARSAQQLRGHHRGGAAARHLQERRLVLRAMHPMAPVDGFTNDGRALDELDPDSARRCSDVLNAGATIGAVRHVAARGHYRVRSELYEYPVATSSRRSCAADKTTRALADLERIVAVALHAGSRCNAETSCETCIRSTCCSTCIAKVDREAARLHRGNKPHERGRQERHEVRAQRAERRREPASRAARQQTRRYFMHVATSTRRWRASARASLVGRHATRVWQDARR